MEHALEVQTCKAPARRLIIAALPIEAACNEREAPLVGQKGQIANAYDSILQVGGNDGEIFLIEGDKPQEFHG